MVASYQSIDQGSFQNIIAFSGVLSFGQSPNLSVLVVHLWEYDASCDNLSLFIFKVCSFRLYRILVVGIKFLVGHAGMEVALASIGTVDVSKVVVHKKLILGESGKRESLPLLGKLLG